MKRPSSSISIQFLFISTLFLFISCSGKFNVKLTNLRCEYKVNPSGIDIDKPRLSWNSESESREVSQIAYQILVASDKQALDENKGDCWDSQKVLSNQSIQIVYSGKPLVTNKKYFWKVIVWYQNGQSASSETAFWTTGMMKDTEWKAKWIGMEKKLSGDDPMKTHTILTSRMLRKEFTIGKKIKSATAFISGLGLFELYLNGQKVGDQVLAPAVSEYNKRAFYMTFDVTKYIMTDKNVVGVVLGNGRFFAPRTDPKGGTKSYGFPKMICQIEIQYEDGSTKTIVSDQSWKLTNEGPIRKNNEYDGEYYDAQREIQGWSKTGFDDSKWMAAEIVQQPSQKLVAMPGEPIKINEEITPVSVKEIKPGTYIFDLGQNMVGWVELIVKGKRGDKVTLRFAEVLKQDGTLGLENIRTAEVTDTYVLKGDGEERWQPSFTYHGFRFVEMKGFPGIPTLSAIKGKVVHDAMYTTGSFTCSNPMINSIYKNAFWGIRGNYRSMPTDCPQRDERQGWLGDRSAECTGESYVFDIAALYNKWVTDINDAQLESGSIPDVAPSFWPNYSDNTTWPGTFLFASDMLYNQYGDKRTIQIHYPSMKNWINHMEKYVEHGIMMKDTYGDWCVPPEELTVINSSDPKRITAGDYIGTAYFYYELKLMEKFALILDKKNDAAEYARKAQGMKTAFNARFYNPEGEIYSNNTCTVNLLALAFDLVPPEFKEKITDNLLSKILSENNGHIGNGIIGGQWLMRTLTAIGHGDVACRLASQNTYPGWGYMVEHGATTIWELWNGDKADPGMNSHNHVMQLGDLVIWYYENLAGIRPDPQSPGFKNIILKPLISGDISFVNATYTSIYGVIKSDWKHENGKLTWNVSIPANTTAIIYIPSFENGEVFEGNRPAADQNGIEYVRSEKIYVVFKILSGNYSFSSSHIRKDETRTYLTPPVITPSDSIISIGNKLIVTINCPDRSTIVHYTTDNSEPNEKAPVYSQPIEITGNTIVRAQSYREGTHPGNQAIAIYNFIDPQKNGLTWTLYKGSFVKLPDFSKLKASGHGSAYQFELTKLKVPETNFALQMKSYIQITSEGEYRFFISSNDGSKLYIDNQLLIDNDGEHGVKEMSKTVNLSKGKHPITVEYFQSGGRKTLLVGYSSKDIRMQPLPEYSLFKTDER